MEEAGREQGGRDESGRTAVPSASDEIDREHGQRPDEGREDATVNDGARPTAVGYAEERGEQGGVEGWNRGEEAAQEEQAGAPQPHHIKIEAGIDVVLGIVVALRKAKGRFEDLLLVGAHQRVGMAEVDRPEAQGRREREHAEERCERGRMSGPRRHGRRG